MNAPRGIFDRRDRAAKRRHRSARGLVTRVLVGCALTSAVIALEMSCGSNANDGSSSGSDAGSDAGAGFDVAGDGANFCGNEVHKVLANPPLLYFVMDSSGSMSELIGGKSRYEILRETSVDLVATLGSSIRVGAAVFPKQKGTNDTCAVGSEVMAPQLGGSSTTTTFGTAINVDPFGGTPTAATLEALAPKFANAKDDAAPEAVLLVTDGGPNCDFNMTCAPSECEANIEGACPVLNCCDPAMGGTPGSCLDRAATLQAISHVVQGGAKLYVIGLTVNGAYESTLEQMALVGGAAQSTSPFYYQVNDLSKLEGTFQAIAASLISCEFTLADPPKEQDLTNVYVDGAVLLQDPQNGWVWDGTDKIKLVGDACANLKSGKAQDIAVISGCPTETPN